jgi:D-inositol-3-phosphate glycosyltransferase
MNRPRRIALVSEHASPAALLGGADAGGQNVYVDALSRQLGRLGLAVDVFVRRDHAEAPEVVDWAAGVRIVNLPAGPPHVVPKDDLWPFMPAFRDALIGFQERQGVRYDVVHGNFWMSGWVAAELRRALGIPAVQLFHALGMTKRRHQGAADTSPADRIGVERRVVAEVDRVIAQCPNERAELRDDYGACPDSIALIPAGVDTDTFRPVPRAAARRQIGLAIDGPLVVYVGRLLPRKDIRNVVRAIAVLNRRWRDAGTPGRPPRLLVVGGETAEPDAVATPEIGALQRLAAELGVAGQVQFTGQRPQHVLRHYYGAGDVVATTPWYEPFGLTPLEAMACGRPVIGSAVGGIAFTVQDGVTGYLVPPGDPQALADRLQLLLTRPDLCAGMGRAARTRVEREFTWPVAAGRVAALYEELLASAANGIRPAARPQSRPRFDRVRRGSRAPDRLVERVRGQGEGAFHGR